MRKILKKFSILSLSLAGTLAFLSPQKVVASENTTENNLSTTVYSNSQTDDRHKIFVLSDELRQEYVQLLRNLHTNVNAERPDLNLDEDVMWSEELELFANFYVDMQWQNFLSKGNFMPHFYVTNDTAREVVYQRLKTVMPDYPYEVLLNNESLFYNAQQFAPLSREDVYRIIVDYLTEENSQDDGVGHATALLGAKYIGASYNLFKYPNGNYGLHELNTYVGNTVERTYNNDPALEDYALKNLYHNRNNVIRLLQTPKNTRFVHTDEGIKYLRNGSFVKSEWVVDSGKVYYFGENGVAYTGFKYMAAKENEKTPHWCYFGGDGILRTGWQYLDAKDGQKVPHWSYFGNNGWLRTGWQYIGEKDGEKNPHWSYFGDNGWLRTGWHYLDEKDGEENPHWSYFGNNGWLRTGWQYLDAKDNEKNPHWSYFGKNGWLRTGLQYLDEKDNETIPHYSFFGENGWLRTGWHYLGEKDNLKEGFRYFGKNGWMRMGWQYLDAKDNEKNPHYSFFGEDGILRTGLVLFDEKDTNEKTHYSYFGDNGHLVINKKVNVDNKKYMADSRGWLTEIEHKKEDVNTDVKQN